MKLVRIALLAALALGIAAFAGVGLPQQGKSSTPDKSVITVSGTGSVKTTPDQADVSFSVSSRGDTAREAMGANAADMTKVIAALKGTAVAAADVQTSYVSLEQREKNGVVVGYTAHNSVVAKVRDLGKAGSVIDAAVEAGANGVDGPSLARSDRDQLYRTALRAAVTNARENAAVMASAAGVSLGRVTSVVEGGGQTPVFTYQAARLDALGTPIEPGTQEVSATVTVTFAIA